MKSYSKNNILTMLSIIILVGFTSCNEDKLFDEELATNPNKLSVTGFYSNPGAVNAGIIGVYGYLTTARNLGASGKGLYVHHSSDEMSGGSDYAVPGMYNARLTPSWYTTGQPWALMYTAALGANDVIENIDGADFGDETDLKNAYLGEAHMLRAFIHFYLLVNFRNIPISDKVPTRDEFTRPQADPATVWAFIIEDLLKAKGLLPAKGFWGEEYRGRMTSGGAAALLGKVYLTMSGIEGVDKYNEAASEFNEIISGAHGIYALTIDYSDNFGIENENNEESLLEFQFFGDGDENTGFNPGSISSGLFGDPRGFSPPGFRNGNVNGEVVVHDWVYDAYAASIDLDGKTDRRMFGTLVFDDLLLPNGIPDLNNDGDFTNDRLALTDGETWEEVYSEDGTFGGKFAAAANYKASNRKWLDWNLKREGLYDGNQDDRFLQARAHGANLRLIRYADVLLMYAECLLNGGSGSVSALEAVNQVRARAKVAPLGSVGMDAIKTERVLELSLEGTRGLDLLRWGNFFTRFSEIAASDPNFKKFTNSDYIHPAPGREYLPIPISEIQANPNINDQNPGW